MSETDTFFNKSARSFNQYNIGQWFIGMEIDWRAFRVNINLIQLQEMSLFFTCTSLLLLLPCSSLLLWFWSETSDLVALLLSFGDDTGSVASETFIVSLSAVSDILIAKSYWEMLANRENLKGREYVFKDHFLWQIVRKNHRCLWQQIYIDCIGCGYPFL